MSIPKKSVPAQEEGQSISSVTKSAPKDAQFRHDVYNHIAKYAHANDLIAFWNLFVTYAIIAVCYLYPSVWLFPIAAFIRNANNMDKPLWSQTAPLNISQFKKASKKNQKIYKLIFGMWTLFTVNPFLNFTVANRFKSKWFENLWLAMFWLFVWSFSSWNQIFYDLLVHAAAAITGFLLFHVQHTFDGAYREFNPNWDFFTVGMQGSSLLVLPKWTKFFTFGIEYHHIHHLNARVPAYALQECHEKGEHLFKDVPRINGFGDICKTLRYSIYDEVKKQFVDVYNVQ